VLIVDDIVFFPFKGLFWIFKEIYNATNQEIINEADSITQKLSELYMMLDTGKITEVEFDEQEKVLLDRLDEIQGPD
jgi:hypothetical protein